MPYADADTIIQAAPTTLAAVPAAAARSRWRCVKACLTIAVTTGTLAWVAVCAKVIWACWG